MGEVKVGVEGKRLFEEFSAGYYGLCTIGGMLSAGTTHLAITPLDVLKVHMQVNPVKYHSISSGFSTLWKEQGPSSLWRGWSGKFFGYGVQAVKVRVQTQPHFAKGLADGFPKLYASEGLTGFYRGLYPLWGRNLPFSMVMFTTFEHSVDYIYCHVIQRRKEDCSRAQQLGVTCLAGYAAGAVGTILSNPADNIVSSLYNRKADTVLQAVKDIGLVNLFTRSLPIRMTLVGPVVTLQWFFYDTIKVLSGLPTSGGLRRGLEEAI
ncbi:mitochondrial phosphate carrier protein 1, mitochondrial-like isoform X3 [Rhododendron vialii]|uniref:mitochondrial phosphate carrier protein 1, mitochondrial-like isoform X3 n=1 Tax=Rhododendron vialii TaxID=182163 RepID=UPI00265E657D|nr:mitochondrial phosphate carrier protein 1, mitochondrial-like isoform X3 [Rhododendron vialii]